MPGGEGYRPDEARQNEDQTLQPKEEVAAEEQTASQSEDSPAAEGSDSRGTGILADTNSSSDSSTLASEVYEREHHGSALPNIREAIGNIGVQSEAAGVGSNSKGHARNASSTPSLSIDTQKQSISSDSKSVDDQKSPLSPLSPKSIARLPVKQLPPKSPLSPRTRDRGFSLRRSLLARNLPGQQPSNNETMIELDPVEGSSSRHESKKSRTDNEARGKKSTASVSVSPVIEYIDSRGPRPPSIKKSNGPISLPNYEDWVKRNPAPKRLLSRLKAIKESLRKTILRIHELPPSNNGRHIPMDLTRKKPLVDERRGHDYIGNTIRSSRYTLYNFVPRQLFAQFSKLANFYFLCVSILQMIPGLSTTGTYTTIVPLLFFVTISIAKEGYDDLRRYRLDKAENRRTATVLHAYKPVEVVTGETELATPVAVDGLRHWATVEWQDVKVGDVIKLERDEAAPADLVVLQAKGTEGVAYIETMALDGETNLKTKEPSPPLAQACQTYEDIAKCQAHIVVEDPNLDLYNFEGNVTVGEETLPLTNSEIIYRGSILRNTSEAIGMAIYSGEECKIRMNANKNPRIKAPALQAVVNKVVIIIVIFVIALAIFNTVAYQIWQESTEEKAWYLTNAGVAFFPILTSFIILFNTMIPLSLYVSLEIVKLCQMLLMNDIDMYDEVSNTPMEARTSTINEELGQVK